MKEIIQFINDTMGFIHSDTRVGMDNREESIKSIREELVEFLANRDNFGEASNKILAKRVIRTLNLCDAALLYITIYP